MKEVVETLHAIRDRAAMGVNTCMPEAMPLLQNIAWAATMAADDNISEGKRWIAAAALSGMMDNMVLLDRAYRGADG